MAQEPLEAVDIPGQVSAVAERIGAAGGQLFIVGGWVRDRLLGTDCKDIDLATNLPPALVKEALEGLGSIYTIGEKFGTVGLACGDYNFEITTFRTEAYEPGSRHPEVAHIENIEEDLARRDFTVNAMALQITPLSGSLIDPFDGTGDLTRGVLRTPGPPAPRMAEDPLRMMRAVRFAAQLGFEIEQSLLDSIRKQAHLLGVISWERRRDELEGIIVSPNPDKGVGLLVDTGLMEHVSPELAAMKGVDQPRAYHRADVLGHTLLTMTYTRRDALLRRAALFHDVGKPPSRLTSPKVMFPEHDRIGVELTRAAMRRLRYSNEDVQKTAFMVKRHMRPIHYERSWSDAAVRRLIKDCTLHRNGELLVSVDEMVELARADIKAGNLEVAKGFLALMDDLERRIDEIGEREEIAKARSPLDGRELMEIFGRGPGPWLKPVMEYLAHLVVEGELAPGDKEKAARLAREFMESK
jgi:poly(A) polymerase